MRRARRPQRGGERDRASASSQPRGRRCLPEYLTGRQADLWRFLEGLTPGNQVLNAPFELTRSGQAAAALTRCEFDRVRQWRFVEEQRAALAADKSALDDQRQRATDAEQAGRATVHELVLERERADAAERSQKLAERWLGVIQNSASWRLTAPLRTIMRAFRRAHAAVFRSA